MSQHDFFPFPRQLKNHTGILQQHRVTSDHSLEGAGVAFRENQFLSDEGFGWKCCECCSGERGLWKELVGSKCWHQAQYPALGLLGLIPTFAAEMALAWLGIWRQEELWFWCPDDLTADCESCHRDGPIRKLPASPEL